MALTRNQIIRAKIVFFVARLMKVPIDVNQSFFRVGRKAFNKSKFFTAPK